MSNSHNRVEKLERQMTPENQDTDFSHEMPLLFDTMSKEHFMQLGEEINGPGHRERPYDPNREFDVSRGIGPLLRAMNYVLTEHKKNGMALDLSPETIERLHSECVLDGYPLTVIAAALGIEEGDISCQAHS